ncbi:hypothetical protein EMIT053CA3_10500 [Pseudomonas donghuensis]
MGAAAALGSALVRLFRPVDRARLKPIAERPLVAPLPVNLKLQTPDPICAIQVLLNTFGGLVPLWGRKPQSRGKPAPAEDGAKAGTVKTIRIGGHHP